MIPNPTAFGSLVNSYFIITFFTIETGLFLIFNFGLFIEMIIFFSLTSRFFISVHSTLLLWIRRRSRH